MLNIQSLINFPVPARLLETNELSHSDINEKIYTIYGFTKTERDLCKTLSLEICLYHYFFVPLSYETATLLSQLCRPVSRSA